MKSYPYRCLLITLCLSLLGACSETLKRPGEHAGADELLKTGVAARNNNDYELAISDFETLQTRYPFGEEARQSWLEIAYTHFIQDDYEPTRDALSQFLNLYRDHPNTDYALYLMGNSYYNSAMDRQKRLLKQNLAERDPEPLQSGLRYYQELIQRFPQSTYAIDAGQRSIHLYNLLAEHAYLIAKADHDRGLYIASLQRCQDLLQHYPRSTQLAVTRALIRANRQQLHLDEPVQP